MAGENNGSNGNAQGEGKMVPARGAKPVGGFKAVEKGVVETDLQYVGSMIKAYTTSQSLAVEIETEIPLFVTKARQRIMSLIQVIGQLRKELYDAKQQVITVNQRLHTVLTMQDLQVDFAEWEKDLEDSIMQAETPEDIKEAMDKAGGTIPQNGAAKEAAAAKDAAAKAEAAAKDAAAKAEAAKAEAAAKDAAAEEAAAKGDAVAEAAAVADAAAAKDAAAKAEAAAKDAAAKAEAAKAEAAAKEAAAK